MRLRCLVRHIYVLIFTGTCVMASCAHVEVRGNTTLDSFNTAKKHVYAMHAGNPVSFYCECRFTRKTPELETCAFRSEKPSARTKRIEIEHIVPAAHLGGDLPAWEKGHRQCKEGDGSSFKGRNCARKMSELYRRMESDLYNLRPVIGEINQARRDYIMGELPGEARRFGKCDLEIAQQTMEPRPKIRGDIARTWFYMEWAYPGRVRLTAWQRKLYTVWSEADPVDAAERAWARDVARVQGNTNPFIR